MNMRMLLLPLLLSGLLICSCLQSETLPPSTKLAQGQNHADRAFQFLHQGMGSPLIQPVYTEADSGWNILYGSKWLNGPTNMKVDTACRTSPQAGVTCIRVDILPGKGINGEEWNGVEFHSAKTWDGQQEAPFNLTGAKQFRVWLRTDHPGLSVKISFGSENDSCGRIWLDGSWTPPLKTGWQPVTIDLRGKDMSRVQTGLTFVFESNNRQFAPEPGPPYTFYVDEAVIEFDKPRPMSPRLLASFGARPTPGSPFLVNDNVFLPAAPGMRSVSYLYDVSCAALALLARGKEDDIKLARALCDALIYHMANDRSFDDHRLRNGLMSGPVPVHKGEKARIAGWWDRDKEKWVEDMRCASSNLGDLAYAQIALLRMAEKTSDINEKDHINNKYVQAASQLGDWILKNCTGGPGPGFLGGMEGWEATAGMPPGFPNGQRQATYKSTEMNLDCIASFASLFRHTNDIRFRDASRSARAFVLSMYQGDDKEGHFLAGLAADPSDPAKPWKKNVVQHPLDTNSWAVAVLGVTPQTSAAMRWAQANCSVQNGAGGFDGFSFSPADRSGCWIEGCGQMVLAFRALGDTDNAKKYLTELHRIQDASPGGTGLVASTKDGLWTGFDVAYAGKGGKLENTRWNYYTIVHVAATCWYLFSELQYNPYYGTTASSPLPEWASHIVRDPLPMPTAATSVTVVRHRCLPHIEPPWSRGARVGLLAEGREMLRDEDIIAYLMAPVLDSKGHPIVGGLRRKDLLENTQQELLLPENREFARLVLGQRQVFVDAADFMKDHRSTRISIKFLRPQTWYADLLAELDPRGQTQSGPAVCQIGDTWEADVQSRKLAIGTPRRYFWDLHTLIFNRDQLRTLGAGADDPSQFDTWTRFDDTALKLKRAGFMPLALSSAPDTDLLWNLLAPWLWSAGADLVNNNNRPWWWWGDWWQSGLETDAAMRLIDRFIALKEKDCLESRELSASELADGVIRGDYTISLLEPMAVWRARARWPADWPKHIGASLPPQQGTGTPVPFLGGSLLAVLCKESQRPSHAAEIRAGQEWLSYLLSEDVVRKHMMTQQVIPDSDSVWASFDGGRFKAFYDAALRGTGYDSSPSSLRKMHERFKSEEHGAHLRMANWPSAVEGTGAISQLYQFAYRLRVLPPGNQSLAARNTIKESLRDAAATMNERLPSGQAWVWKFVFWCVIGAAILSGSTVYIWRKVIERRHDREWREIVESGKRQVQELEDQRQREIARLVASRLGLG